MKNLNQKNVMRMIFPAMFFGAITGILTATVVVLYKFCAKHVIEFSEYSYELLREFPIWTLACLGGFLAFAFVLALIYRKIPNLRGGGIPTSIGILRGIMPMKWLRNVIGIFVLSLSSFLIGVPLGNEGPSVQIGTAMGRGGVFAVTKKYRAWDRYAMTGGACAGFSVATGAPISGILFAIEEAHQRISPVILIMATTSVMFAEVVNVLLSPLLGVPAKLFDIPALRVLSTAELWIPLVIGLAIGLFAVAFLRYYRIVNGFFNKTLKRVPLGFKIFFILSVTMGLGLLSYSFISTGHHLILSLLDLTTTPAIWVLLLILIVRATLTIGANSNRITGGIFLPVLAIGTLVSAVLGKGVDQLFGLGQDYYSVILILGIAACISGMMKMPLTAVVFSVEALSGYGNILAVIVVVAVAYIITEIFAVHSINDSVLETRIEELHEGKSCTELDIFVTVQPESFAIGKQIRDIFWPNGLFVLSVRREDKNNQKTKADGGKEMREGDVLHVHCNTFDREQTLSDLYDIIGVPKEEEPVKEQKKERKVRALTFKQRFKTQ